MVLEGQVYQHHGELRAKAEAAFPWGDHFCLLVFISVTEFPFYSCIFFTFFTRVLNIFFIVVTHFLSDSSKDKGMVLLITFFIESVYYSCFFVVFFL